MIKFFLLSCFFGFIKTKTIIKNAPKKKIRFALIKPAVIEKNVKKRLSPAFGRTVVKEGKKKINTTNNISKTIRNHSVLLLLYRHSFINQLTSNSTYGVTLGESAEVGLGWGIPAVGFALTAGGGVVFGGLDKFLTFMSGIFELSKALLVCPAGA